MTPTASASRPRWAAALLLSLASSAVSAAAAFSSPPPAFASRHVMSTTVAPPPPKTDRYTETETDRRTGDRREVDDLTVYREGPLEYLEDEWETRDPDDPFHILLMGATFEKPRISVSYVSGSICYVLDMPEDESYELTSHAKDFGMSCLGTWSRVDCLTLGRQLQVRDIVCRVVPFCEGGARGWQARDASEDSSWGRGEGVGGEMGGFQ